MKFSIQLHYAKPIDLVMKMLTDRAYFDAKYQALDVTEYSVLDHQPGEQFLMRYKFQASGETSVPDFAKKVVGDTIRVEETDTWHVSKRTGAIDIKIAGAPAKVHADMKLEASDAKSCVLTLDWSVKCSIPLIGGKIETTIADDIKARAKADEKVSVKLLKGYK